MSEPIPWTELPLWVPGEILLASDRLGWSKVALRSYRYAPQDVLVPAMEDFMIVGYRTGVTPMERRFGKRWTRSTLGPGAASLLTRAQPALWNWDEPIDVTHVYLAPSLVREVAGEVLGQEVDEVTLADVLRAEDPVMNFAVEALAHEAGAESLGGALYVESIARALIVHLMRRYASVQIRSPELAGGLSPTQQRRVKELVEAKLSGSLSLDELSGAVGLSPCVFARLFRQSFGIPPYGYVIERRVAWARRLLSATGLPIKQIAHDCGFADQSHMTRMFRRLLGTTPARYRRDQRGG